MPCGLDRTVDESSGRTAIGRWLLAVVALALLARLAVIGAGPRAGSTTPTITCALARSLAEGRGFVWDGRPTAYRPPLYPLVLAPLVAARPDGKPLGLGDRRAAPALGAATVAADASRPRALGAVAGAGAGRGGDRGARPGAGRAEPDGDDRDPGGLPAGGEPGRARPAGPRGRGPGRDGAGPGGLCRPSTLPAAVLVAVAALVAGPAIAGRSGRRGADRSRRRRSRCSRPGPARTPGSSASRSGRRRTADTRWPWRTTRSITPRSSTAPRGRLVGREPGALVRRGSARRVAGLSEPAADRRLRAIGAAVASRAAPRLRPGLAGAARPVLGRRPAGAVYPGALRARDGRLDGPALGSPWPPACRRRALWRWPRIAAPSIAAGADGGPRGLLDRPADAGPLVPAIALIAAGEPRAVCVAFPAQTDRTARNDRERDAEKKIEKSADSAVQIPGKR